MSFNIVLQQNFSADNQMQKNVVDVLTLTGELREETSIIDPIIKIEADLEQLVNVNYMTCPMFGRSYFIRNIRSIRAGLVEISCHVDVLQSFRSEIRMCYGIAHKQQERWNLYLNDGTFKIYQVTMAEDDDQRYAIAKKLTDVDIRFHSALFEMTGNKSLMDFQYILR